MNKPTIENLDEFLVDMDKDSKSKEGIILKDFMSVYGITMKQAQEGHAWWKETYEKRHTYVLGYFRGRPIIFLEHDLNRQTLTIDLNNIKFFPKSKIEAEKLMEDLAKENKNE